MISLRARLSKAHSSLAYESSFFKISNSSRICHNCNLSNNLLGVSQVRKRYQESERLRSIDSLRLYIILFFGFSIIIWDIPDAKYRERQKYIEAM